jgi:prepilin peptidase CpaA
MTPHQVIISFAIAVAAAAAWSDHRTGRISNTLTFGALAFAPILHFAVAVAWDQQSEAIETMGNSFLGAAACSVVPLVLYRTGGIHGGDVKLLAAMGAICGPSLGIETQVLAFMVAAAFAMGAMAYRGELFSTLCNVVAMMTNPLRKESERRAICKEMLHEMRFGPSVLAGTLAAVIMGGWRA